MAEIKGVRFTCRQQPTTPKALLGDASRLQQVLLNLIGNAFKFTEAGEVEVGVRTVRQQGSTVVLEFSVRDTGIGIPLDKQDTIFDSFVQGWPPSVVLWMPLPGPEPEKPQGRRIR